MNFFRANILSFVCVIVMIGLSIAVYPTLPEQVPSEFNIAGETVETISKQVMAPLLPSIYLGVMVLINLLIKYSPNQYTMPNSQRAVNYIIFGIGVLLCFLHYALLLNDGDSDFFLFYFAYGMAFFLIIVGNIYGKTERNFFLGLRTPWAIASKENWRVTHRLAGRLMVTMGLLLLISNTLYPSLVLTVLLACSTAVVPAIYSFVYFLNHEREQNSD